MRALVYEQFRGPVEVVEVPAPTAPAGGAVVRVASSGLCRSDWHAWVGHDSDVVLPQVPGHEFAGVVAAVGVGVDPAWVGRSVTAPFVQGCGECAWCRAGEGQVCPAQRQPGFTDPGSFAELVVVWAASTNLVPLPPGVPASTAAGLGCRVATAYRAVTARARVRQGEWVAVFGCGGVGLSVVAIAAGLGARVVAVDRSAAALDRARALGAEGVLPAGGDAVAAVVDLTAGGAAVAFDCLGSVQTCRDSILALARRGRQVQIGLLPPSAGRSEVPMDRVIGWELDVMGSHGMAARDYPAMLADVASGRLAVDGLLAGGPALGLRETAAALVGMADAPSTGIVLVDPST